MQATTDSSPNLRAQHLKALLEKSFENQEQELLTRLDPDYKTQTYDDEWLTHKLLESVVGAVLRHRLPNLREPRTVVKALKGKLWFRLGRKLLRTIIPDIETGAPELTEDDIWLRQQCALCTYKDEELSPRKRFTAALKILEPIGLRNHAKVNHPGTIPETLGLGGAIYKRRWDHGRRLGDLHMALFFYRAAWRIDYRKDIGYGGANAAFVLDLLGSEAARVTDRAGNAEILPSDLSDYAAQATSLRKEILDKLIHLAEQSDFAWLAKKDWFQATLAEIYFALGDFAQARDRMQRYVALAPDEWQRETTFRQFRTLGYLHDYPLVEGSGAWTVLAILLPVELGQAMTPYNGKIGLALSGGGFRASFYHLGVMARMAEIGILPYVEVLSTVSGGSIVGALYYLELRKMLTEKVDRKLLASDYVRLVHDVQRKFLEGVEHNLRMRVLASISKNFQMLLGKFNRSRGLGKLYEEFIYQQVEDEYRGRTDPLRPMDSLVIEPCLCDDEEDEEKDGEAGGRPFHPRFDNWRRTNKVPVLLLNATSLNSGHAWSFTASWMGEPPRGNEDDVDRNRRYRRLYYGQAPTRELRKYPLGYAVAASSCVPMLFEPLEIGGLYAKVDPQSAIGAGEEDLVEPIVQLVDGGVHDNQGLQGLVSEACNVMLCSDASGQMNDDPTPGDNLLAVGLRTMSVQGDRIREAQYQDVDARAESAALDGLFFVHLKQDIDADPIDWVGCSDSSPEQRRELRTEYDVDKDLQRKLAAMRTDLDSFTEVEAYALMASGYQVAKKQFKKLRDREMSGGRITVWGNFNIDAGSGSWPFTKLIPIMGLAGTENDPRRDELGRQLDVSAMLFGKIWKLDPLLRFISGRFGMGLLIVAAIALVWLYWDKPLYAGTVTIGPVVLTLVVALATATLPVLRLLKPQKVARSWVVKIWLATIGAVLAKLHLKVFDPMFIKQGRLARLLGMK